MSKPRTLIFSANAPPSLAASAQILGRLTWLIEDRFGFIHRQDNLARPRISSTPATISPGLNSLLKKPAVWRFEELAWYYAALREGIRQTGRAEWDLILACHPSMAFTLAAARVARVRKLPLALYLIDLFSESRVNPVEKYWAKVSERNLFTQAEKVICLTEGLQDHYAKKYTINTFLIPHCVTEAEIAEAAAQMPTLEVASPITVTFAGGVYQARLDALVAVKQAVTQLNTQGYPTELLILCPNSPEQLKSWGIDGPYVTVRFIRDRSKLMETLRLSDILLSTIAFNSNYPLQDKTCFPTKTFDYFLAGKPILVIAPGNSYYADYMNRHLCGLTVESSNVDQIAIAIRHLATDFSCRSELVKAGFIQLHRHSQELIQPRLMNILSEFKSA